MQIRLGCNRVAIKKGQSPGKKNLTSQRSPHTTLRLFLHKKQANKLLDVGWAGDISVVCISTWAILSVI